MNAWNAKSIRENMLVTGFAIQTWMPQNEDLNRFILWIQPTYAQTCKLPARRSRGLKEHKVYWWTEKIANLQTVSRELRR